MDPLALLAVAHEKNGLSSSDVRPWHIRGTYSTFDVNGKPEDHGIYEEWWASPARYKRAYAGTKFKQVDYATGSGLYRDGSTDWPSGNEMLLRASLIEPLPDDKLLKDFVLQLKDMSYGQNSLRCVRFTYELPSRGVPDDFFRTACFSAATPTLRLDSQGTIQTTYNEITAFQGHYLARHLHRSLNGKAMFDFRLDVVESLDEAPDTLFSPPASAFQVDITTMPMKLANGARELIRLKDSIFVIPESIRSKNVDGHVVVRIIVGKDGHVVTQQIKSGTFELRQSVLDAARNWMYMPFLVMGKPIEVEAEIEVSFTP